MVYATFSYTAADNVGIASVELLGALAVSTDVFSVTDLSETAGAVLGAGCSILLVILLRR